MKAVVVVAELSVSGARTWRRLDPVLGFLATEWSGTQRPTPCADRAHGIQAPRRIGWSRLVAVA
jgi:hypothetical protein